MRTVCWQTRHCVSSSSEETRTSWAMACSSTRIQCWLLLFLLILLLLTVVVVERTAALVHDLQYPQAGFSSNSKDVADV